MTPHSFTLAPTPLLNQRGRDITPIPAADGRQFLIPLTKNYFARVDAADLDKVCRISWYAQKGARGNVYAGAIIGQDRTGKHIHVLMHRLVMSVDDPAVEVDHVNRDETLDNTRNNLRVADHGQQQCNSERPKARTGYWGVANAHGHAGFTSHVDYRNKRHHCGTFATAVEAAHARDRLAVKLQGEFAKLNFPEMAHDV